MMMVWYTESLATVITDVLLLMEHSCYLLMPVTSFLRLRQAKKPRERLPMPGRRLSLFSPLRTAWLTWEETESRLSAAKSSLRFAEENLRVTSERYDAGLAPHTEVLDAESLRSAAEARVVHAASERIRAWLRPHQEKNHPLGLNAL